MDYVFPFMLVDGDREAMEFDMTPGSYDATLAAADQYLEGDLVRVDAGKVKKASGTAANLAGYELFVAGADWHQPFAMQYLLDAGVPLNVIPQRNQFVFTYRGSAGAGADYTLSAADIQAAQAHARRELAYDSVNNCLVVTNGTTNPKVTLLGFFGEVEAGVTVNPRVIVRIDTGTGA